MSRPKTGYYSRNGIDRSPDYRSCDACRVRVKRADGGYVKTSELRQIWCCTKCQTKRMAKAQAQEAQHAHG